MVTIKYPDLFSAASLHSVWAQVQDSGIGASHQVPQPVLVDLTSVKYLDAEGANYVALIPHILQAQGKKVCVSLPTNANVLRFLESLGVMEHIHREFVVQDGGRETGALSAVAFAPLVERHNRLISRALHTTVFRSSTVPSIFRSEVIRHHLFALNEATATAVCGCVFELVANVMQHSEQTIGCLTIQYRAGPYRPGPHRAGGRAPRSGQLFVAVSDLGIGIRHSLLRQREGDVALNSDADDEACLRYAVQPGTSRFGLDLRGHGLPTVLSLADMVHLSSGKASLYADRRKGFQRVQPLSFLQGTSALLVFDIRV